MARAGLRRLDARAGAVAGADRLLVDPLQLAVPQLVPALLLRQAPAPLQVPSKPQGGLAAQRA